MTVQTFDIIVIGAGIAGASVAAHLASGHRVIVLEREEFPGFHSTGRSAALFSEIYGNVAVRALSRASRDFFHWPPDGFTEHPLVKPRGALYIARREQLPQLIAFEENPDISGNVRRLAPEAALRACPILRPAYIEGAVMEDDAADVDVDALHSGYLRQFRSRGGALAVDADVRRLTHVGGNWHVETQDRVYEAPIVVNAAGAWADSIAEKAQGTPLRIQPCRRTALLVELPPGLAPDAWPMVIDIDESFYMKPDAGLLLISPADETPVAACDIQPEELDVATAIERVEQATSLAIRRIRKRWAGLRSFAPDRSPIIGFDETLPGFFWLAGQGGYGIQTAPAAARLAAALVGGQMPAGEFAGLLAALSPQRFSARSDAAVPIHDSSNA